MKIKSISVRKENLELTRPYTISYKTVDSVENVIVEIQTDTGHVGWGAANPSKQVVGETVAQSHEVLSGNAVDYLVGQDIRSCIGLCEELFRRFPENPGVRVALDVAFHDLLAQYLEVPLVTYLGPHHPSLPTSITIGIKSIEESLMETEEYLGRGFTHLKVKLGTTVEQDIEMLARIREKAGPGVQIRIDANQGYDAAQMLAFWEAAKPYNLELVEQPLPAGEIEAMRNLPEEVRALIAADEALVSAKDALLLASVPIACGIFNIKLMKCGGIYEARRIATIAQAAGIDLMWGCNDESIISITGALHAALAAPNTRYLDLDGSLDLARDVVSGGFVIENGRMSIAGGPGLGLKRA